MWYHTKKKLKREDTQVDFIQSLHTVINHRDVAEEIFSNRRQEADVSAPIGRDELADIDAYLRSIEGGRPVVAKVAFGGEWI